MPDFRTWDTVEYVGLSSRYVETRLIGKIGKVIRVDYGTLVRIVFDDLDNIPHDYYYGYSCYPENLRLVDTEEERVSPIIAKIRMMEQRHKEYLNETVRCGA